MQHIYKSAVLALVALLAGNAQVLAAESIVSFDSTIKVLRDGALEVHERIVVNAEGDRIRRGIYRDFPTIYRAADGRQILVGFMFASATRDGQPEPWRTENQSNGVRVYLGSASVLLPHGEHVYELEYHTDRQMGFFADHDELYWNVTGNGWGFAIEHASARVELPDSIPESAVTLEGYTGPQGSKGQDFSARYEDGAPTFRTTGVLEAQEGLTVVVMWPKGFIVAGAEGLPLTPTPLVSTSPGYDFERDAGQARTWDSPVEAILHRTVPHNRLPALIALLGLGLLLFYYYRTWDRVGRDPPGRVIIPEYEMPKGQSAASMRYLLRMSYDNECFASAVLSLAVKGYLRINQDSGVLGVGKSFTLIREATPRGSATLSADEQQLLADLFESGDTLELKQIHHTIINGARTAHGESLKGQYSSGFFSINGGWHALGIGLSLLLAGAAMLWPGQADTWPKWYFSTPAGWLTTLAVIAGFIANGIFGKLLKAPTVAGRAIMDHIEGFKMYLEVAEGEDLKRITRPPPPLTPQLYEAYLPAALALGVEQRWAERFAKVFEMQAPNYSPAWYAGNAWNASNLAGFSSNLGASLGSAISSSAQAPGSSSGGGGGGSSGGGGGGGGGGGW